MRILIFFVSCLSLFACGRSYDLQGFDEKKWQQDKDGCSGQRINQQGGLKAAKNELKGLSQKDIILTLGKPDKSELYERSEKFFYYQISPSKDCTVDYDGENVYLSIRFNSIGLAKEVLIIKE